MSFLLIGRMIAAAALAGLSSGAAQAALGSAFASVAIDNARLGAHMTSVPMGGYTRHDLTRPNGGMVHEFTDGDGQVFAVTWSGPGKPDLRTLLGARFTALQAPAGGNGRAMHARHRPLPANDADLHIETEGHMGWFRGIAYLPGRAPAGFQVDDLQVDH